MVFNVHIALNPALQSQVVTNGISFFITNFETVGYVLYMELLKWIFAESFGCFSLKDTKETFDLLVLLSSPQILQQQLGEVKADLYQQME